MRIETDKQQVYNNVMQLTATAGRNRGSIAAIAATEDNLPALGIFLAEAVTEAENELRRHIAKSSQFSLYATETSVVVEIKDLLRAADSTQGQISSSLMLYLTHYAVARWVSDIEAAKDLAEPYNNSAAGYLDKLKYLVCQRDEYSVEADAYEQRALETDTDKYINGTVQYEQRALETDTDDKFADGAVKYEKRALETDTNNDSIYDKRAYKSRQEDLQPIRRTWPDGVITDNEGNILVSKT